MGQPPTPAGGTSVTTLLDQMVRKYGPVQGSGYGFPVDPIVDAEGALGGKMKNPYTAYRYTFADGTVLEATETGEIKSLKEGDPTKAAEIKTGTDKWGGLYERTATGEWKPVIQGDQDAYRVGQLAAQEAERKTKELAANVAAGRGNLTDVQWNDLQDQLRRGTLDENTLKQRQAEFAQTNQRAIDRLKIDWAAENRLGRTAAAQIGLTEEQTRGQAVETSMNEERLRQLIKAGPAAEKAAILANEVTEAQLAAVKQKLVQPTVLPDQTGAYMTTQKPGEAPVQSMSLGYVPKTEAEIQARTGQIRAATNAKEQEILAKYKDNPEAGLREFNSWYDANVASQVDMLNAARQDAALARGKEAAEAQRLAMTTAQAAGTGAVEAYKAEAGRRVGPRFNEVLGQIGTKGLAGIDTKDAFTYKAPGAQEVYAKATAQALKDVSPLAAQMSGAPMPDYSGLNPAEVLNRSNWKLQGGAPQPTPTAGAAAPATAAAAPAPTPTPEQLQNQRMASFQTEAATNAAQGGMGPIGNDPMRAAMERMLTQPAPAGTPAPAAAPVATAAPARQRIQPIVPQAPPPVAPINPTPGFGYDPSAMAGRQAAPGFGYDPSNMLAWASPPPAPQVDYMSPVPPPEDFIYEPPIWQPGDTSIYNPALPPYSRVRGTGR